MILSAPFPLKLNKMFFFFLLLTKMLKCFQWKHWTITGHFFLYSFVLRILVIYKNICLLTIHLLAFKAYKQKYSSFGGFCETSMVPCSCILSHWLVIQLTDLCWLVIQLTDLCWLVIQLTNLCWLLILLTDMCWLLIQLTDMCWLLIQLTNLC